MPARETLPSPTTSQRTRDTTSEKPFSASGLGGELRRLSSQLGHLAATELRDTAMLSSH